MFYQIVIKLPKNKLPAEINERLDNLLFNFKIEIKKSSNFTFRKHSEKNTSEFIIRIIKNLDTDIENFPIKLTNYLRQNFTENIQVMRIFAVHGVESTPCNIEEF